MPKYSKQSIKKLETCCVKIQELMNVVIVYFDCSIICGFRNEDDQEKAFDDKKSKLHWPNSKHNNQPSMAVDVWPYPVPRLLNGEINDYSDRWKEQMWFIKVTAVSKDIKIICGGEFKGNFKDYPHFEII